ncbi:iron-containing alcohol dehydrogenase [Puniceicoccaceae bacterium K14]|nr:iron-containing alcohol dehydrogenase [Puniceicoccaceae bacterium K14]
MAVFKIANRLHTGAGCLRVLEEETARLGMRRPLLVIDKALREIGISDRIAGQLGHVTFDIFSDFAPEPDVAAAKACSAAFVEGRHDGLIAVGGGSSIDIAKVVSVYAGMIEPLEVLFEVNAAPGKASPLIAIPTTAGTGSEVTNIAILSDEKAQLKRGVVSDYLLPDVAIVSPEMTVSMPKSVTAASGIDAFVHAIEAFLSVNSTPVTDGLALKAMSMIVRNLPRAYREPENLVAREQMATASLMAGMAFGNAGVGAVHALAYPLGGRFKVAHGVSNALLLPYVMEWNKESQPDRFREIANAMGIDIVGESYRGAASASVDAMRKLCRTVGIQGGLRAFGVPETAIPSMAVDAIKIERLLKNNPRKLTREDIEAIYREAY